MTSAEIITRVRQIVQETDSANAHAADSTILGWLNEAIIQLVSTIKTLPKESITGEVAASTVTLSADVLRVDYAAISNGATPPVYNLLDTIDFCNFVRLFPLWANQSTGQPTHLVRMTGNDWMMWPSPDATWTGKALLIYAAKKPADMVATTETPSVPLVFHSALVHYCAWLYFLLLNNQEKANGNFATYEALRQMNLKTGTTTTGSLQSFKIRGA